MTQVDIANIALDEVGKNPITSMADTSSTGQLVRRHFDTTLRKVAAEPTWWEFDETILLNPAPDVTYDGTTGTHRYRYDLPARTVLKGVWDIDRRHITDRTVQKDYLFADQSSVYVKYVPLNITAIPEYIGFAISYLLASRMAKKADGTDSRSQLYQIYRQEISSAKKVSQSQKPAPLYGLDSPYSTLDARVGLTVDNSPPARFR